MSTTHEMQLSQAAGLAPTFETGGTYPHPPPGKPMGLKKIHRLLRGRYPMVIVTGGICAILGAILGFLVSQPMYSSEGDIMISPTVPSASASADEMLPGYSTFLQSQVALIESPEMITRALGRDEWKAVSRDPVTDDTVDRFSKNLSADEKTGTNMIKIVYNDPDAKIAQAGAVAMCLAYREFFESEDPLLLNHKISQIDQQLTAAGNDLQNWQSRLSELSSRYGTDDLASYQEAQMVQLAHLDQELSDATMVVKQLQTAFGTGDPSAGGDDKSSKPAPAAKPMSEEQIATIDPNFKSLREQKTTLQSGLDRLKANGFGSNHPRVQSMQSDLDVVNAQIQTYVDSFNRRYSSGVGGKSSSGLPISLQAELDSATARKQALTDRRNAQDRYCHEIGLHVQTIHEIQARIESAQRTVDQLQSTHDALITRQKLMESQMEIVSMPSVKPEPSIDHRKQLAVLGFLGGGLAPAFFVVLIGLLDQRFRFSDEAGSDMSGVPLLGILPNLPDLLTDPDQAATAAHCVHQIRTILQITSHSADRRVFAITSSATGDGKTSLTLALGLSFAASGSKTLLIDADLIGGGLTSRLNAATDHGVLEAMAARDISAFIRSTDVADLSILPVGLALSGYSGAIAPAAVRRLVDEARTRFDIIVIDTGPILGSIEASPVAVASDGVVLCVSRGQQRQMVDRALQHLQSIGAKLAGVVFNRAQPTDFERSVSRLSIGVGVNGNGRHQGEPIGPVAKAVASSVRPGGASRNPANKG